MTSTGATLPLPLSRQHTGTLLGQTMTLVAMTTGVFALAAYVGRESSSRSSWLWYIAAFGLLLALNGVVRRSDGLAIGLLLGFGGVMGLATAPAIRWYADADPQSVWQAGGATALFIAGCGAVGYSTRRDLSALARWSLWGLIALIAFGIVAIFVQIPNGALIYSVAGLVIFAGLTTFDFQRLRRAQGIESAPQLAASIFLDVLNVFLFFLPIFGGSSE